MNVDGRGDLSFAQYRGCHHLPSYPFATSSFNMDKLFGHL